GRFDEAVAAARRALELDPRFPFAYAVLGFCYTEQLKHPEAIAALEKALSLDDQPMHRISLAYAQAKSGNEAEARKLLASLIELTKPKRIEPDLPPSSIFLT